MKFNHVLWEQSFKWRSPYYGWHTGITPLPEPKKYGAFALPRPYQMMGTVSMGEREIYYMQSIETSTHKATLAYELRQDATSIFENTKVKVQLRLKGVFLFNKAHAGWQNEWHNPTINNPFSVSSSSPVQSAIPNYQYYTDNKNGVDGQALQSVHLYADYSLCPGIPDHQANFQTTTQETSLGFNTNEITKWNAPVSTTQNGKRTLKSIQYLGLNGTPLNYSESHTTPPHDFIFEYGSGTKNPAYALHKTDYWGTYNASRDNWYDLKDLSATDAQNADAWSLHSIKEATGKLTLINYQSDKYSQIKHGATSKPTRMVFLRPSGTGITGNSNNYNSGIGTIQLYSPSHAVLFNNAEPDLGKTATHIVVEYDQICNNGVWEPVRRRYSGKLSWSGQNNSATLSITANGGGGTLFNVSGMNHSGFEHCAASANPTILPSATSKIIGAYLLAQYDSAFGGGIRVGSLITTDLSTSTSYTTEYEYFDGVATSEPKDYDFFNHVHNSLYASDFSGMSPMVAYGKVRHVQKGTDNRQNGYIEKAFNVSTPIAKAIPHTSTNLSCQVYIPITFLQWPLNQLKDTVLTGNHNGKFYQAIPEVIKCHILSEPGYFGTPTVYKWVGGTLASKIGYSSASSGNTIFCNELIYFVSSSALGDYTCNSAFTNAVLTNNWPYYSAGSAVYEVANSTVMHLYGQQFGQPLYEKVYSTNDVLLSTTTFEYEREAYYQERFKRNLLAQSVAQTGGGYYTPPLKNIGFTSQINHYRYRQKKSTSYIDGIAATTTVLRYDEATGQPLENLTLNESVGGQSTEMHPAFKSVQLSLLANNKNILGKKRTGIWTNQTIILNRANRIAEPEVVTKYAYGLTLSAGLQTTYDANSQTLLNSAKNKYTRELPIRDFNVSSSSMRTSSSPNNLPIPLISEVETLDDPVNLNSYTVKSKTTLIAPDFKPLEQRDVLSGLYSATLYAHKLRLPIAQIAGANYYSFSVCGFESIETQIPNSTTFFVEGEVKLNTAFAGVVPAQTGVQPHTGTSMVRVKDVNGDAATNAPHIQRVYYSNPTLNIRRYDEGGGYGIEPNRKYRASVWLHNSEGFNTAALVVKLGNTIIASISGSQAAQQNTAINGWYLLEVEFETPSDAASNNIVIAMINSNRTQWAYFDDFRFHPINTALSSAVYDAKTGWLSATLDANNFATRYVYDHTGRVIQTWLETRKGWVLIEENEYETIK